MPKGLLKELQTHIIKIDGILATLEELINVEGIQLVTKAAGYKRGDYVTAETGKDIARALEQDQV